MTRTQVSAVVFAFTALFAGQAMAASDAPLTSAQVQTELTQAITSGNMIADESGERMNEVYANNYPAQHATSTVTRAQVEAELAEAIRTGNVVVGESGAKLNKVFPHKYSAQQNVASKNRDQVRADLANAAASGQLSHYIEA